MRFFLHVHTISSDWVRKLGVPKNIFKFYNQLQESVRKLPEWIQAGCGDKEYYCEEKGATFLSEKLPEKLDLTKHNSYFADVMKSQPDLYEKLKDRKTSLGVTLGQCIKTGVDNPGKRN